MERVLAKTTMALSLAAQNPVVVERIGGYSSGCARSGDEVEMMVSTLSGSAMGQAKARASCNRAQGYECGAKGPATPGKAYNMVPLKRRSAGRS